MYESRWSNAKLNQCFVGTWTFWPKGHRYWFQSYAHSLSPLEGDATVKDVLFLLYLLSANGAPHWDNKFKYVIYPRAVPSDTSSPTLLDAIHGFSTSQTGPKLRHHWICACSDIFDKGCDEAFTV